MHLVCCGCNEAAAVALLLLSLLPQLPEPGAGVSSRDSTVRSDGRVEVMTPPPEVEGFSKDVTARL